MFLRKERCDRGKSRLPDKVNAIFDAAINKIYLKAEQPDVAAVIEEVHRQCFKINVKKPHPVTVRRRAAALPDRLKLEKRSGRKITAARFEPIKGCAQVVVAPPLIPKFFIGARVNLLDEALFKEALDRAVLAFQVRAACGRRSVQLRAA